MRTDDDDIMFWSLIAEDRARIICDQTARIEALENALRVIVNANPEFLASNLQDIAQHALAPETGE